MPGSTFTINPSAASSKLWSRALFDQADRIQLHEHGNVLASMTGALPDECPAYVDDIDLRHAFVLGFTRWSQLR